MRSVLLVMTNCAPGQEEEFNTWYQDTHLKEVLEVDGFVGAQRYEITDAQLSEDERPHRFLAIYEIEGDADKAFENLMAATDKMNMSATLVDSFTSHFTPIGARVES